MIISFPNASNSLIVGGDMTQFMATKKKKWFLLPTFFLFWVISNKDFIIETVF